MAAFLKLTGIAFITKILFHLKDVILVILFICSIVHLKIKNSILAWYIIYLVFVVISIITGFFLNSNRIGITSFLFSVRGLILMPTLTLIGYSIQDKKLFLNDIKKYYHLLVALALIGIIEFALDIIIGTKSFWMDFLGLDEFYTTIKGASAGLENGTPGNWYTDIGKGYRTQKRLISVWAAPLTAGFVIMLPCLYYALCFCKNYKSYISKISVQKTYSVYAFGVCTIALILTFTRQVLVPVLGIIICSYIYYQRKNKKTVIISCIVLFIVFVVVFLEKIILYVYNGSTKVHIMTMIESINKMSILGNGVGSYGTRYAGTVATESQYLTVMGQLGVFAIIPYIVLLTYPIVYCKKKAKALDDEERVIICSICFSGLCVVFAGILSETVAAFTSIAQYYILIGFSWGYCKKHGTKRVK